MPITHSFHPLPDRDRSRIASGLWVQRLPPVAVTLLLIVWVTLSGDTRNVLVEMIGIEPIVTKSEDLQSPAIPLRRHLHVWYSIAESNRSYADENRMS